MKSAQAEDAVERINRASRRSALLGAGSPDAISLAIGEPDGGTSAAVVRSAIDSLTGGRTRYSPMSGSHDLRKAIADHASRVSSRDTVAEEVVLTHGGSAALAATLIALVNPGDRILIPEPTYSLYADQAAMIGADVAWFPHLDDGSLDVEALRREACGASMLILCNPGNPTGNVYNDAELRAVEQLLIDHPNLLLLADEAYADIVFDGLRFTSALSLPRASSQVIVCGTFSKTYAMTGWRLGYVIAPKGMAERIGLIHRTLNGPLNTFVQDAGVIALKTPQGELQAITKSYESRRDLLMERLCAEPRIRLQRPKGAFYAFPKIESSLSSNEMVVRFAEAGVLVRSGSEFGRSGEGHIRLSFATDRESLKLALNRFATVVRGMA